MKRKLRVRAFVDEEGRKHIAPSDIGGCLRAMQLRLMDADELDLPYSMLRGTLVHKVVEDLIKSSNPITHKAWLKTRRQQAWIKKKHRLPLNVIMPKYEESFKNFLTTKLGKQLTQKASWIEEKIAVHLEDLPLKIPLPLDVLKKYKVVGEPDCYFGNLVLEFKTGEIRKKHYLQGLLYEKMLQVVKNKPEIRNRIVSIGPRKVKVEMMNKFWLKDGKYRQKKEEELVQELTKIIINLEMWEKNPKYKMPRTTTDCYNCLYYKACYHPLIRLSKFLRYRVKRYVKCLKTSLKKTLRNMIRKKERSGRNKRIPLSKIPQRI